MISAYLLLVIENWVISGASSEGERGVGKNGGREPEEGGRSSEEGSRGAAAKRGGTLSGTRAYPKRKRRGYAQEEAARGRREVEPDEAVG